jgi:hypothetical protein
MESLFLLAFGEEEFLAALPMAASEAFFNKLPIPESACFGRRVSSGEHEPCLQRDSE